MANQQICYHLQLFCVFRAEKLPIAEITQQRQTVDTHGTSIPCTMFNVQIRFWVLSGSGWPLAQPLGLCHLHWQTQMPKELLCQKGILSAHCSSPFLLWHILTMSGVGKKSMIACIEILLPEDIFQFPYIARVKQAVFVRGEAWNDSKCVCDRNAMFLQQIESSPKGSINGSFLPYSFTAQCVYR